MSNPPAEAPAPARRRRRRRWPYIVGAVVLLLVLSSVFRPKPGEQPIEVTFETAAVRTITQLVPATGRIQPEVEVKISAEVAGEVVELPVVEGQAVRRGDLLARIRPEFYERAVEQSRAIVAAARAQLLQAAAVRRQRELDLRDSEQLRRDGVRSESELRAALAAFESADASVQAAEADIARAEASLRQAEDNLSKTTILAPRDLTVSVLNIEEGDRVVATGQFSGTEIMRLADLTNMEVRVNVNENDVVNVTVGDTARVLIDAYPGRVFQGTVYEIANAARLSGTGTQEEVTNFEVRIRLVDPGVQLRPGMSASADIETETVADAITVPIQSVTVRTRDDGRTREDVESEREEEAALNRGEGAAVAVNQAQVRQQERTDRANLQRVVFVRTGDTVVQRAVTTGISDFSHIVITDGVAAGDEVVSGSFAAITRTLKDGSRVTLEKPRGERGN